MKCHGEVFFSFGGGGLELARFWSASKTKLKRKSVAQRRRVLKLCKAGVCYFTRGMKGRRWRPFLYYCRVFSASSITTITFYPTSNYMQSKLKSKTRCGVNLCKCNQNWQCFQYAVDPDSETLLQFHRLVKHCYDKMLNRCSSPLIWTVDHQTNSSLLLKTSIYFIQKDKQTSTSALGHDWMFNAVDVRTTRCLDEGNKATWSCVFTMLCVGGDAVVKGCSECIERITKKKKENSFFFLVEFLSVL